MNPEKPGVDWTTSRHFSHADSGVIPDGMAIGSMNLSARASVLEQQLGLSGHGVNSTSAVPFPDKPTLRAGIRDESSAQTA
jgi:hypothetical protein